MSNHELNELSPGEARAAAEAFDLLDLPCDYFQAPHLGFRLLRDHDPVHRNADGTVLLTQYADVRTVWRDVTASVDKKEIFERKFGGGPLLEHHTTAMLFRDPPDHDRRRVVVNPFFAPRSVERFRPYIEQLVDALLDEAEEAGELDFVTGFAARIPISLTTRILGVPSADGDYLRKLGLQVLFPLNPTVGRDAIDAGNAASAEFRGYLMEHVERIRATPAVGEPESVLEALVRTGETDGAMSDGEIVHMCLLVLNGGHETTTNLMAVSTLSLLDHPDQAADLRNNGDDILGPAIEECVRFVSPLQLQGRRTDPRRGDAQRRPDRRDRSRPLSGVGKPRRSCFRRPGLPVAATATECSCCLRHGRACMFRTSAGAVGGEHRITENPPPLPEARTSRRADLERERPLPRSPQSARQGRLIHEARSVASSMGNDRTVAQG